VQYNTYYFLMNKAKYDGLSHELQAVIDACSGQAALDLMIDDWDTMTETAKAKAAEAGDEVYTLSDEEHAKLVAAAEKVTQEWIAAQGDKGQQVYDAIVADVAKY